MYHFRRDEWVKAGAWGLMVGLTRPNGCLLSAVLAGLLAERLWKARKITRSPDLTTTRSADLQLPRSLVAASMPGIGMLLYSAYIYQLTGMMFGWARLQGAWGRSFSGLEPVGRAYGWITDEGLLRVVQNVPFDTLNSLGLIFTLLMVWPVFRRLGPSLAFFVLVNIGLPMLGGGVLSLGRMSASLFPVFIALAVVLPPRMVTAFVIAFAAGQGLVAALFFTWRPLF